MMMLARLAVMVLVGAALGYGLGSLRTCPDGGCPLTATPKRGALWGGFMGLLMAASLGMGVPARTASTDAGAGVPFPEVRTSEQFTKEVLERPGTSLVYFHATWCPACRQMEPVLKQVVDGAREGVGFVKVDTDKAGDLAEKYDVRLLPTILIFQDGVEKHRIMGGTSARDLLDRL